MILAFSLKTYSSLGNEDGCDDEEDEDVCGIEENVCGNDEFGE